MHQADLEKQVFDIQSEKDFENTALAVFEFQAKHNKVYKRYIDLLNVNIDAVQSIDKIPFLPIHFFKHHQRVFKFTYFCCRISYNFKYKKLLHFCKFIESDLWENSLDGRPIKYFFRHGHVSKLRCKRTRLLTILALDGLKKATLMVQKY